MSVDDDAKSEDATAKGEEQATLALEYLKLARVEILDKTKFVNQTLGAYLAGSAALTGWFYQAVYKPPEHGAPSLTEPQKMLAAAAFASLIAYLAFAVNWIIYTNERLITALARYQRRDLRKILGDHPPMWERSRALRTFDDLPRVLRMVFIEELIVLAPPVLSLVFAWGWVGFAYWKVDFSKWWPYSLPAGVLLVLALLANVATIRDGLKTRQNALKLRSSTGRLSKRGAARTSQVAPLHQNKTQHN